MKCNLVSHGGPTATDDKNKNTNKQTDNKQRNSTFYKYYKIKKIPLNIKWKTRSKYSCPN